MYVLCPPLFYPKECVVCYKYLTIRYIFAWLVSSSIWSRIIISLFSSWATVMAIDTLLLFVCHDLMLNAFIYSVDPSLKDSSIKKLVPWCFTFRISGFMHGAGNSSIYFCLKQHKYALSFLLTQLAIPSFLCVIQFLHCMPLQVYPASDHSTIWQA